MFFPLVRGKLGKGNQEVWCGDGLIEIPEPVISVLLAGRHHGIQNLSDETAVKFGIRTVVLYQQNLLKFIKNN